MTSILRVAGTAAIALLVLLSLPARGASPADAVAFEPPAGVSLPLDAAFVDEHGRPVRLADYVVSKPAIVVPAYYGCSNLCTLVLNGLRAGLDASRLRAGADVDVVVVSIDPFETPALALAKKRDVVGAASDAGWHFLTGAEASIARFADALGYRYAYDASERQYAHASGIAIVAPGGRLVRVLYGVAFAPDALRSAVDDAATANEAAPSLAATVSGAAQTWLLCFHYDPRAGRYTFAAINAVRGAGIAALLALGACGAAYARRRNRGASQSRR